MGKSLSGFSYIEVILYLGLFALLSTALFAFSWNIQELYHRGATERVLAEEGRFALERIKYTLRNASGIDEESSRWDDAEGKLVVELLGTSDTVAFERQGNQLTFESVGQDTIFLHSSATRVTELRFERLVTDDGLVNGVSILLVLEAAESVPPEYTGSLTLRTSVLVRNSGL